MIRLVDGNNYFRRMIEGGALIRNLVMEVQRSATAEVWTWDGKGANARRRKVYPAYKSRRQLPGESFFEAMSMFQGALLHTKAVQIRVPGYEADDVIASIAARYHDTAPIQIVSTDKDLMQLTILDQVTQDRPPIPGVEISDIRLWKTLVGDQSDAITGIPGFGQKAWEACNKEAMRELLEAPFSIVPQDLEKTMEKFGVTKKVAEFLMTKEDELRAMHMVIGFFDVPQELINANTVTGVPNQAQVDQVLKAFLQ